MQNGSRCRYLVDISGGIVMRKKIWIKAHCNVIGHWNLMQTSCSFNLYLGHLQARISSFFAVWPKEISSLWWDIYMNCNYGISHSMPCSVKVNIEGKKSIVSLKTDNFLPQWLNVISLFQCCIIYFAVQLQATSPRPKCKRGDMSKENCFFQ